MIRSLRCWLFLGEEKFLNVKHLRIFFFTIQSASTSTQFGCVLLREVLRETMDNDELRERDQWTMFGNEAEKVEIEVIRNQHMVRRRMDRMALRKEVTLR